MFKGVNILSLADYMITQLFACLTLCTSSAYLKWCVENFFQNNICVKT